MTKLKHRLLAALLSVSCLTALVGCSENGNGEANAPINANSNQSSTQGDSQDASQNDPVEEVKDNGTVFTDLEELVKWKEVGAVGLTINATNADMFSVNAAIEIASADNDVYLKVPSFEITSAEDGETFIFENIELCVDDLKKAYINTDTFYKIIELSSGEDAQEAIDQMNIILDGAEYVMFDIEQLSEEGEVSVTTDISDEQLEVIKDIGNYFITKFMPIIKNMYDEHADALYTTDNGVHSITLNKDNIAEFTDMMKSFVNGDEFIAATKDMMGFIAELDETAELPTDEEFDEMITDARTELSENLDKLTKQITELDKAKYTISTQIVDDGNLGGLKGDAFSLTIGLEAKGEVTPEITPDVYYNDVDDPDYIRAPEPQKVDMNIVMEVKAVNAKATVNIPADDISCDFMAKMAEMQESSPDAPAELATN